MKAHYSDRTWQRETDIENGHENERQEIETRNGDEEMRPEVETGNRK